MKILIFSEYFYPHIGGVEVALKKIAEGLVERGHEVGVVARQENTNLAQSNGINFFEVRRPPLRYFYFLNSMRNWKIAKGYDVIHTYNSVPMLSGLFLKNIFRKPCALTVLEVLGKSFFKYSSFPEATVNYFTEFLYPKMNFDFFASISNI